MRLLISLFILSLSAMAQAVPVMDVAVGTKSVIMSTVVPDDKDPNLYYFFPSHYGLAMADGTNHPLFSYVEKKTGWFTSVAFINTIFTAYLSTELTKKEEEIVAANPKARFAPIPISNATFSGKNDFSVLLSNIKCQEKGNTIGQQLACKWDVNSENKSTFRHVVRSQGFVQVLEYNYTFSGMYGGKFTSFNQSAAVYFNNLTTADFFDSEGRRIKD